MAQLLEILGKGLVGSLWSIFGKSLQPYKGDSRLLKIHLQERPEDAELLLKAAVSFYREELMEKAMECAVEFARRRPDKLEGTLIMACVLEGMGERIKAAKVLQQLVEKESPNDPGLYFALGYLYETAKEESKALYYYHEALEVLPNLVNAHQRLAAIALRHQQIETTISHYQAICKIEPEDMSSRILLAGLYLNNGQARKAVAEYQIAMTIEPDNWETENEMVRACVKAGDYNKAIELLEDQLVKQGEFPDTYLQLAELYGRIGDDVKARQYYQKAIGIHPGYLEGMIKFGTYQLKMGRFLQAAEWFSKAIDVNDRLMSAYVGLAVAQYHTEQNKKATETLELAQAIEPNSTMLFAEVARLELKASAAKEAKDYLNPDVEQRQLAKELLHVQSERFISALEKHPERADWHYRYGLLLKAQNETAAAAEEFRQAVTINPDYVKALVKLGLALNELGEKDEAKKYLEQAVTLKPEFTDVHYQLGLIYADQARYRLAIEEFEETLRGNQRHVDAMAAMAQALETIGMHEEASASWQAIIELAPESEQAKLARASLS
jgi:pentatricopeptide repeat protein